MAATKHKHFKPTRALSVVVNKKLPPGEVWSPNPNQLRFLEEASQAGLNRNVRMLCKNVGISTVAFYKWYSTTPAFRDALDQLPRTILAKHLPGVYAALIGRALAGSLDAIRLVFELAGELGAKLAGTNGAAPGTPIVQIVLSDPAVQTKILDAQMAAPPPSFPPAPPAAPPPAVGHDEDVEP